jgi:hypothetical protein
LAWLAACSPPESYEGEAADRELAEKHCQSCHQLPTPDLLDKTTWRNYVFPKMGPLLGIRRFAGRDYPDESTMDNSFLFPEKAVLTDPEWAAIIRYYTTLAPDTMPPQAARAAIAPNTSLFKARFPKFAYQNLPVLSLVKIDTARHQLCFGEAERGMLYRTDTSMTLLDSVRVGTGPVQMEFDRTGFYLLNMGTFHPSDGTAGVLRYAPDGKKPTELRAAGLSRPTHFLRHDLNADGREDYVVCGFGYYAGSLDWFENTGPPPARPEKHPLNLMAGAIQSALHDFDRDGKPDLLVLMAQGNEGFDLYPGTGSGFSTPRRLLQFHPSFGSNSFSLADFNGDGHTDIVATNGDNGDYRPILKNYHGVRIYLNDGDNNFSEKYFFPVNGITKAVVADFDRDGDLDIAAIAYFPDYSRTPQESFVYLENRGDDKFAPATFGDFAAGRWQVMDAADADGDGDLDILLGSCVLDIYCAPTPFWQRWQRSRHPIMLLENTTRK